MPNTYSGAQTPHLVITDCDTGITGYKYRCRATNAYGADTSEAAELTIIPDPVVNLVCASESGTATLCGSSEFTNPSTPPKKYRNLSVSGYWQTCNWDSANGACTGATGNSDRMTYQGSCSRNSATCGITNTLERLYGSTSLQPCNPPAGSHYDNLECDRPYNPVNFSNGDYPTIFQESNTQTVRTWTYEVGCTDLGSFGRIWSGTVTWTLSQQDTDADAMARATKTPGSSCTATHQPRGAGVFSFDFSEVNYDLNASALYIGLNYKITVDWLEEDYGGGNPSTTQKTYNFTASATTHTESDSVICPYGKQVTVQNAVIEIVS